MGTYLRAIFMGQYNQLRAALRPIACIWAASRNSLPLHLFGGLGIDAGAPVKSKVALVILLSSYAGRFWVWSFFRFRLLGS